MDGIPVPGNSPAELSAALRELAPSDVTVAYLADSVERSALRIAELSTVAAAKKRLIALALPDSERAGFTGEALADMQLVAAEADNLVASTDARTLAFGRSLRQDIRLIHLAAYKAKTDADNEMLPQLPQRFSTEKRCREYLAAWGLRCQHPCPRCGCENFYLISARTVRECTDCGIQSSLREGTITEGSRISLRLWFSAIQSVMAKPSIESVALSAHLGEIRVGTARKMKRAILAALANPERSELLAGLDLVFGSPVLSVARLPQVSRHLREDRPRTEPLAG